MKKILVQFIALCGLCVPAMAGTDTLLVHNSTGLGYADSIRVVLSDHTDHGSVDVSSGTISEHTYSFVNGSEAQYGLAWGFKLSWSYTIGGVVKSGTYYSPANYGKVYNPVGADTVLAGNTYNLYLTTNGVEVPTCTTNLVYNVKNTTAGLQSFFLTYTNTIDAGSAQSLKAVDLYAGQSATLNWSGSCDLAPSVRLCLIGPNGINIEAVDTNIYFSGDFKVTDIQPTGTGGTFTSGGSSPIAKYDAGAAANSGTNSPIIFQSTNTQQSTEQGAAALFTQGQQLGNQAHADAVAIVDGVVAAVNGAKDAIKDAIAGLGSDTNLVRENTFENYTNALLHPTIPTNSAASEAAQGASSASSTSNTIAGLGAGMGSQTFTGDSSIGTPTSSWQVIIPYGGGYTINLDPFALPWVASIAAFLRALCMWVCAVAVARTNINALLAALNALGATRQATASGEEVLGTNLNLATALVMAVTITAVMVGVPVFAANWFSAAGLNAIIGVNPFTGASASGVSTALWMVNQFFPLLFMSWCATVPFLFRASLGGVVWFVQTITRFLVG